MPISFSEVVAAELLRAESVHAPIHSYHEGYAVLLEELDEVKEQVWKREPSHYAVFKELVQVAAMAERMAKDLQLTTIFAEIRLDALRNRLAVLQPKLVA